MSGHISLSRRSVLASLATLPIASIARGQPDSSPGLGVQRLAWAGIRLSAADVDLFVDATSHDPGQSPGSPALESTAARCFALATHHHGDHLDLRGLAPLLGPRGYLVVHEDVARFFDHRIVNLQVVRAHEPVFLSRAGREFVAWCVPAADGFGSPQYSWVIEGAGRRVIHCGDTIWHGGWWDIARAYGPFDAAFLPVNGARQLNEREIDAGQPMVMTPEQAAAAAAVLQVKLAIPIHYGGGGDGYIEEPDAEARFSRAAAARGIPVRVLRPGDRMRL